MLNITDINSNNILDTANSKILTINNNCVIFSICADKVSTLIVQFLLLNIIVCLQSGEDETFPCTFNGVLI